MSTLIAQHPLLWLMAAFLSGLLVKWLLDVFFLREERARLESTVRKTKEELESERFGHNRLQGEFKTRMAELDQAQKGRTLAESLLTATKARLAETETVVATARQQKAQVDAALTETQRQLDGARTEAGELRAQTSALSLRLADVEAETATHLGAAAELRQSLASVSAEAVAAQDRIGQLERAVHAETTKSAALESDLLAALQQHSDTQAHLLETKGALTGLQDRLFAQAEQAATVAAQAKEREGALAARDRELKAALAEKERLGQLVATQTAELTSLRDEARRAAEETLAANRRLAAVEAEKAALAARCDKLETATGDARADAQAAEHKLKARIDEVKELANQLGEASEELAELRKKSSQLQANLDAASATRLTLEQEVARLEAAAAAVAATPPPPPPVDHSAELASLREEIREWEREVSSWKGKAEEVEAELLATSRAHRDLEAETERLRGGAGSGTADEALLAELEVMTRERNEMAAEVAGLKAQLKGHGEA